MDDSSEDLEFGRQIAALKHDLGKYVAWMSANLDEESWHGPVRDELIDALERDLLRTRTPAEGPPEPAWAVWQRLGGALPKPWRHPELHDIDAAVATLRSAESALRARDRVVLVDKRAAIRDAQRTIRGALQQLHRRLLQAGT